MYCLSPFSVYEVVLGIKQKENTLLEKLLTTTRLINFDIRSSMMAVQIMKTLTDKGQEINIIDIFIALIAISNNLTLVSLDNNFKKI